MRFQYDPAKAVANLKKHGISFADAEGALEDPLALSVDDPDSEGEARFITLGTGSAGELLVVAYTERRDARLSLCKGKRGAGAGYQTMMNEALRQYLSETDQPVTEETLRQVLRQEMPE